MCIILDANCHHEVINFHESMKPVRDWLYNMGGKIVYSDTEEIRQETGGKADQLMRELARAGKLKRIPPERVEAERRNLFDLHSNDVHIVALALAAGVKVLVSHDKSLHRDFKRHVPKGSIYQEGSHRRLLTRGLCP